MPISQKIVEEIYKNTNWSNEFKELLLEILNKEETVYSCKKEFEKLVEKFLSKEEDKIDD